MRFPRVLRATPIFIGRTGMGGAEGRLSWRPHAPRALGACPAPSQQRWRTLGQAGPPLLAPGGRWRETRTPNPEPVPVPNWTPAAAATQIGISHVFYYYSRILF